MKLPKKPKIMSRRFPIQTMFIGVVSRPIPHRDFNGKIFMEWVSRTRYDITATVHTNFSDDALVDDAIKSGEWRQLVDNIVNALEDLIELITGT